MNANKDFFKDLGELKVKLCKKHLDGTITKGYLSAVSANNLTFLIVKYSSATEEEAVVQCSAMPLCMKEALLQSPQNNYDKFHV